VKNTLVIEAVRKTVTVDSTVEEAFRVFTEDASRWWPIETHSILGDAVREIVFEAHKGGEVYEVSSSGEKGHWATVVSWEPPNRIVLAWNILERDPIATELEVRFLPAGERTRVELDHRGWEAPIEDARAKRDSYDTGWKHVLARYEERAGQA
jgi:uncharacterized protein YndB with AHSA1/START domain